jgi:DEAD/DEAH box helicase domain-containing protein
MKDRARIRDRARVLITNPDMLHASILPCHAQFRWILSGLAHVVVDEAHTYRGAFGCHTALVLRRLRRLCADVYGRLPAFVFCTATLANPREHVRELAGIDEVELVDEDASPCGAKHFVLWNSSGKKTTSSPMADVARLLAEMVQHGLRCIAFCKTRKLCEQVLAHAREVLEETTTAPEMVGSICVYRGGYVASERRQIEADLFGGRLRGVAATNALELGIDVGHVDATLHLGFPGSIASLWQQAGRSGRRSKDSIAVYVAFDGALDQYFMNYPAKLFGKPIERCHVDAQNRKVLRQHLACAAAENPLCPERDQLYFGGEAMNDDMSILKDKGVLTPKSNAADNNIWKYSGPGRRPSQSVSIRAIEQDKFTVKDATSGRVMEEIEESKAFFQVHQGAVYMHQGVSYLVERLDLSSKTAYCRMAELSYHTKTEDLTDIAVALGDAAAAAAVHANECTVTTRWAGYRRIYKPMNQVSDVIPLHLPSYSFDTQAVWATVPATVRATVEQSNLCFRGGVHAASHAILSILPLHMMCSSCDLGAECADPEETVRHSARSATR